jgi:hypothetical protein
MISIVAIVGPPFYDDNFEPVGLVTGKVPTHSCSQPRIICRILSNDFPQTLHCFLSGNNPQNELNICNGTPRTKMLLGMVHCTLRRRRVSLLSFTTAPQAITGAYNQCWVRVARRPNLELKLGRGDIQY